MPQLVIKASGTLISHPTDKHIRSYERTIKIKSKRGLTPLELAGYEVKHMPIYQYLTALLLFNIEPAKNLALLQENAA